MRILLAVSLALAAATSAAQQPCTYPKKTIQLKTPAGPGGFHVDVRVGGGCPRLLQVDTGSTGIVLWRRYIPRSKPMNPAPPQPFIYYNSSKKAMCGEWVLSTVEISDASNTTVSIPDMPVLAVDYMCIGESQQTACACKQRIEHLPDLGMLGVGFDRGFGMGGARENPFLRLPEMDQGTIHRGYVITSEGITLGMSEDDVRGFQLLPLTKAVPDTPLPDWEEWTQARGCVAITGAGISQPGKKVCGEILMDTGVDAMYLSYAQASLPAFTPAIPPLGTHLWQCVVSGSCDFRGPQRAQITVTWPDTGEPKFTYRAQAPQQFDWRQANPATAFIRGTALPDPGEQVFVNTSRQLLTQADYLYDATCGAVGFRDKAPQGGGR
jgi:hypothetical protein